MEDHGANEASRHGHARSPEWGKVEKAYKTMFPACAICGSKDKVQVHHVWPFHICIALDRPDLELDPRNFISLCEGESEHHLLIGHLDDFRSANVHLRADIQTFRDMTKEQIKADRVWQLKVKTRLKPLDELSDIQKDEIKKRLDDIYPRQTISPFR